VRYIDVDGRRVSVIGLGCWQFGSRAWDFDKVVTEEGAEAIIQRALDLGVTLLDTAEVYGRGRSELIVGRVLAPRRPPQGPAPWFLATKFTPLVPVPRVLVRHCTASLQRLRVPQVALYQIHWPNPLVPLRRQMAGLRQVMRAGLVEHAGVSNFSLARWRAADRALGRPVLANQVRYNLLQRGPERRLLPFAAREGRLIIAYSPLAQGLLGGRYAPEAFPSDVRRTNPLFTAANYHRAAPVLRAVAAAHGATPAQVALAYLIAQPRVVVIPGARSVAQLESNVAAADLVLSPAELRQLRLAADRFQPDRVRSGLELGRGLLRRP